MSFHSESGILVHVEIFLLILVELVLLNRLDLPGVDGNCLLVALSALATTMQGWRSCSDFRPLDLVGNVAPVSCGRQWPEQLWCKRRSRRYL